VNLFELTPFKVIRRSILAHAISLILIGLIVYSLWHLHFVTEPFSLIVLTALLFMIHTTIISYLFFSPLGRLLAKSKNIKRGTYEKDWDHEYEPIQDFGEWYELELTLNKIHREIKKHKDDKSRREREIETLAGAVSDGVIAIDSLKRVQYFNGQMALILGKEFDPLSPPSYLDEVFRAPKLTVAVDEVLNEKEARRIHIQMRPHKSLENHVFDVTVNPVVNLKKNKFYGVIAVFHDITEAKKVEELRIDFVANASHELKTPLTSIKGYVDSLKMDYETQNFSAAKEKLAVVERNVNRLTELVADLLTLSRLDASDETSKEDLSIEEMTSEVVQSLSFSSKEKRQDVSMTIQAPIIFGNRLLVLQVLSNLVENAIKYSPEEAKIQILWSKTDGFVVLRVVDNGPGVSEEHAPRLFERFYRVQQGKARSGVAGTGLGLSIAKNSMLKMGGRIEVESLPGHGSQFICYFPDNK
jgi:two-component system, OmpR family, phosphate regulon sensor histidine kinase PhoR